MGRLLIIISVLSAMLSASIDVGVISAMRGDVSIVRGGESLDGHRGFQLLNSDLIETGKKAKAQIRFADGTVVTVGKNSNFEIENYSFKKRNRKANFRVKRGFFNVITGKISKLSPKSFKLRTKTSTIGVRGTHFKGYVKDSFEEVACLQGAITVAINDKVLEVLKGEIITLKGGSEVDSPRRIKGGDLERIDSYQKLDSELQELLDSAVFSNDKGVTDRAIEKIVYGNYSYDQILYVDYLLENSQFNYLFSLSNSVYSKTETVKVSDVEAGLFIKESPVDGDSGIRGAWVDGIETSANTIAEKRGGYNSNYWIAGSDREAIRYSGYFVGENTSTGTETYQNGQSSEAVSGTGELYIDFNSKYKSGSLQVEGNSIEFTNIGSSSLSYHSFGVSTDNLYSTHPISSSYGRYYGKSGDSVGTGYLIEVGEDQYFRGYFIGEAIEKTVISKGEPIGKSSGLDWGYWNYNNLSQRGAWIDIAELQKIDIVELKNSNLLQKYSGEVFGTFGNQKIENGSVDLTFDFATESIFGLLTFNTSSGEWRVALYDGDIAKSEDLHFRLERLQSEDGSLNLTGSVGDAQYLEVIGDIYSDGTAVGGVQVQTATNEPLIGAFVAVESSSVEQVKRAVESGDFYSWGYWESRIDDEVVQNSSWLNMFDKRSSVNAIMDSIDNSVIAQYSGSVHGVAGGSEIRDGSFELNVDFAKNSVNGDINFMAGESQWSVGLENGRVIPEMVENSEAFLSDVTEERFRVFESSSENIIHTEVRGDFYGEDLERVGGSFNFVNSSGDRATGILVGEKK